MKFGRSYHMAIEGRSSEPGFPNFVSFGFPLTLEFNVVHNIFASANVGDFSIFNLSARNRSEITFNQFLKPQAYSVQLRAGYISQQPAGQDSPTTLPVIFQGFANVAYTERSGVDLVTRVNALDNGDITTGQPPGYLDGTSTGEYIAPKGASFQQIFTALASKLTGGVQVGKVNVDPDQIPKRLTRPKSYIGTVWEQLQALAAEAAGAKVYIESGVCNILGQNSFLSNSFLGDLDAKSGLLGVPRYTGYTVMCSCIFEPRLKIGSVIGLNSTQNKSVNNDLYKVIGYTHRGKISAVESGELISDITLLNVTSPLGENS